MALQGQNIAPSKTHTRGCNLVVKFVTAPLLPFAPQPTHLRCNHNLNMMPIIQQQRRACAQAVHAQQAARSRDIALMMQGKTPSVAHGWMPHAYDQNMSRGRPNAQQSPTIPANGANGATSPYRLPHAPRAQYTVPTSRTPYYSQASDSRPQTPRSAPRTGLTQHHAAAGLAPSCRNADNATCTNQTLRPVHQQSPQPALNRMTSSGSKQNEQHPPDGHHLRSPQR